MRPAEPGDMSGTLHIDLARSMLLATAPVKRALGYASARFPIYLPPV